MGASDEFLVYVGTYTTRGSEGIYVYRLDLSSGALEAVSVASGVSNPSFLAVDPTRRYLYAVNEIQEFAGARTGAVSAFAIDWPTGKLAPLNQQSSGGAGPCHLSVDRAGRFVYVANYAGGSVSVLPIEGGGRLSPATDVVQHRGSSLDPRRQEGPHAHSINLSPDDRYAFVADLGLDRILCYRLDVDPGRLVPHDEPWVEIEPGAGPRHFSFHPRGETAYVINELDSTITAFQYNRSQGTLAQIQTISTLPSGFAGRNYPADLHIDPRGRHIYGSNRGHDSIVLYEIDPTTGLLRCVGHEPTQGRSPRNFGIDPTGAYVLVANQDTDTIISFHRDAETGQLTPTGHTTHVPAPVCVCPVPRSP